MFAAILKGTKHKTGRRANGEFFGLHFKPTRIGNAIAKGRANIAEKLPIYRESVVERQTKKALRNDERFRRQRAEMVELKHRSGLEAAKAGFQAQRARVSEQEARIRIANKSGKRATPIISLRIIKRRQGRRLSRRSPIGL